MACLRIRNRSVAIPSMPGRFAVALRASIDRMSSPRWWLIKQTRGDWWRDRALISEWDWQRE